MRRTSWKYFQLVVKISLVAGKAVLKWRLIDLQIDILGWMRVAWGGGLCQQGMVGRLVWHRVSSSGARLIVSSACAAAVARRLVQQCQHLRPDMASSSRAAACLLLVAVVGVSGGVKSSSSSSNVSQQPPIDTTVLCPDCQRRATPAPPPTHLTPADMHVLRLEAIKTQLLSKLRLQHRPNVSLDLPRQVLLETVLRSGDPSTTSMNGVKPNLSDDDILPVTSEIITFATPGE